METTIERLRNLRIEIERERGEARGREWAMDEASY